MFNRAASGLSAILRPALRDSGLPRTLSGLGVFLLACCGNLSAAMLDWDILTWTPGALSQTYYATNSGFAGGQFYADDANAGVASVTVIISGNTAGLLPSFPSITNSLSGGISPAENNLLVRMDQDNRNQTVTFSITFNYALGVSNVSYTLFDVDRAAAATPNDYIDQITSLAGYNGTNVFPAFSVSGSPSNAVSGSGLGYTVTGVGNTLADSSNGNVYVHFGTAVLTNTQFTYGNNPSQTLFDPRTQRMGLYDVLFDPIPIPEYGTTLGAVAVGLAFVLIRLRRGRTIASTQRRPREP